MKDFNYLMETVEDCKEKAKAVNIELGEISKVKINTRAKQRWGLCSPNPDGTFTIEISNRLLEDNVSKDALYNTVMHELLHTVEGCLNHKEKWKKCAEIVNKKYGFNIKRTTSAEEKNITTETDYKYIIQCPDCGYQWKYIRMTKCVKYPSRFKHIGCSTKGLIRIL